MIVLSLPLIANDTNLTDAVQVLGYTMAFVFDYGLVGLWCGILTGVVVTGEQRPPCHNLHVQAVCSHRRTT